MKEHDKTVKRSKGKDLLNGVAFVSVILLLGSGVAYFTSLNEEGDILKVNNTLGQRLDDAGWMVYVMNGCGACEKQKETLGTAIYDIKVLDVTSSIENYTLFVEQGFTHVPTWHNVFSNETRLGAQSIEQLEEMAR